MIDKFTICIARFTELVSMDIKLRCLMFDIIIA
jgi:hypothetical protein